MRVEPKKLNPNFLDDVLRRRSVGEQCQDHPAYLLSLCALCDPAPVAAQDGGDAPEDVWKERVQSEWMSRVSLEHRAAKATHAEVVEWAAKVRENHTEARSLFLLGSTGVGKTYQAYGALKTILWKRQPVTWRAICEADLLGSMRPTGTVDTETELQKYKSVDVLLVDDFGSSKCTEWVEEVIYRLVNHRFEWRKPTIFTTNLTPAEVSANVGDRVASRLVPMCSRVILDGPDRRRAGQ